MRFIGIDPGIHGAVAILTPEEHTLEVFDTPIIETDKGKNIYSETNMAMLLITAYIPNKTVLFMEKVNAMPGQGVVSMFNFGQGFGIWKGIIAALGIPSTLVTPQAWKKEIMEGIGAKDAARLRAQQLFPNHSCEFALKKHDGRAEACLIAEYGRRHTKG